MAHLPDCLPLKQLKQRKSCLGAFVNGEDPAAFDQL